MKTDRIIVLGHIVTTFFIVFAVLNTSYCFSPIVRYSPFNGPKFQMLGNVGYHYGSSISGIPFLTDTGLKINGEEVFGYVDQLHPPLQVYDCLPIELDANYSRNALSYSIHIYSTDPATGYQVSGAGFLDTTFFFLGAPQNSIDLRCLADPVECDLFSDFITPIFNTFAVTLEINGEYLDAILSGHFAVHSATDMSEGGLTVNDSDGIPCEASHDIQTPCPSGNLSSSINLFGNKGNIEFFKLAVEEVSCTDGSTINPIYDGPEVTVSEMTDSLIALALNALYINGQQNFFADSVWLGRCLKVTATAGNVCGSSTNFSYLQFDGSYFNGGNDPAFLGSAPKGGVAAVQGLSVFPNPFVEKITVAFQLEGASPVSVTLMDASGKTVARPLGNTFLDKGGQRLDLDAGTLVPGVYFLKVVTSGGTTVSKVIKSF